MYKVAPCPSGREGIQCYVKRVKRLSYVDIIATCNAMSKGLHWNTISCNAMYVKGVKRHSKYAVRAHSIFAHNFLNIQPIFNPKMSKGLKAILPFNPFDMFQHT